MISRNLLSIVAVLLLAAIFNAAYGETQLLRGKSSSVVNIDGVSYYVHTVKKGDNFYSLSNLYGVTQDDIRKNNPQTVDGLRVDQIIKIPFSQQQQEKAENRLESRNFEVHTVQQGEAVYSLLKHYGISLPVFIEDNPGVDPTLISIGQQLNIRRSNMGSQTESQINKQWNEYAKTLNSVAENEVYHVVQKGETLYDISRRYKVPQYEISRANNIQAASLKAGSVIKIPAADQSSSATEQQQRSTVAPAKDRQQPVAASVPDNAPNSQNEGVTSIWRRNEEPRRVQGRPVNVSLLLPLSGGTAVAGNNFLDFYQGVLMGLEDVAAEGVTARLTLFDTHHSKDRVEQIVSTDDFSRSDLIIGPVYEEVLSPVLRFAERENIPVVSPLAQIEQLSSPLLYQLSPDPLHKYDKLKDVLGGNKNIVVVTGANDTEFEHEIAPYLPSGARRVNFMQNSSSNDIDDAVRSERETVVVVLLKDAYTIDRLLSGISSVHKNLVSRSVNVGRITVVGSPAWQRSNIDHMLFFKLNLCFISSYYADRSNPQVASFNQRYAANYGSIPSLYSYRGYDAARMFVAGITRASNVPLTTALNLRSESLLQMAYRFQQDNRQGSNINTRWALVCYHSDYTISVE